MKLTLKGERCYCPTCGKYFSRISVFDMHRTGHYGGGGRCMTTEEMQAKGMKPDAIGVWRGPGKHPDQECRLQLERGDQIAEISSG